MRIGVGAGSSRSRRGFSLLEVTFATGVLLVTLMAAIASQVAALNLVRTSREHNTAMAELTAAMEEVLVPVIDTLPVATSPYADDQPIAAFEGRVLRDERITCDYPGYTGGAVPDPLEIRLTLEWTDWAGRPARARLSTMKAR